MRTKKNLRLAYEAAITEAKQQEATLDDLRNRSVSFMSAMSIAFSIFFVFDRHVPHANWWLGAAAMLYFFGCILFGIILRPQHIWYFVQEATWLLNVHETAECDLDEDHFYRFAAKKTIGDNEGNARQIKIIQAQFKLGLASFLMSIATLIGAFLFR